MTAETGVTDLEGHVVMTAAASRADGTITLRVERTAAAASGGVSADVSADVTADVSADVSADVPADVSAGFTFEVLGDERVEVVVA